MDGPAHRENGDDAIFLELELPGFTIKALVDTGASDCFMSRQERGGLPPEQIIDAWQVDKGNIHLADNSNMTILEQVRIKFRIAGTTVCYDFNIVDNLCHKIALKADVSFPGPNCEIFGGNPITVAHEIDVPQNSEMILPVQPQHLEQGIYCEPASVALVMVEACVNLPGKNWWINVMNSQEEAMRISPGDVLAYATNAAVPQVTSEHVPDFLDVNYLGDTDVHVALGRVAKEAVEELVQLFALGELDHSESEKEMDEKIASIDLT